MNEINAAGKSEIRKRILNIRDSIPPDSRKKKSAAISEKLFTLPEFSSAKSALLYASFGSEVETYDIIDRCLSTGVIVALPRVVKSEGRLELHKLSEAGRLEPGYCGIAEPPPLSETLMSLDDIEIVIVPGVAFDESCNRIGYGKGYYDKLLAQAFSPSARQRPFLAALAFEEQIVSSICHSPYDINMDVVITDKRMIKKHGS